ncbi:hypothetical protein AK812_SmicGene39140 [Symbiodinium microadriaticum]|uniref:Uncharacterized protein n=1 Tax=Symbiodinium microadriaticum TaxID=2951 RepID=A0A1Q9CC02_SYMMI|nr:hypothetical protein AK812_SmicGene39140 [Symbiodinium microadriaticum]
MAENGNANFFFGVVCASSLKPRDANLLFIASLGCSSSPEVQVLWRYATAVLNDMDCTSWKADAYRWQEEKHSPFIVLNSTHAKVVVGKGAVTGDPNDLVHPMVDDPDVIHFIQLIWVEALGFGPAVAQDVLRDTDRHYEPAHSSEFLSQQTTLALEGSVTGKHTPFLVVNGTTATIVVGVGGTPGNEGGLVHPMTPSDDKDFAHWISHIYAPFRRPALSRPYEFCNVHGLYIGDLVQEGLFHLIGGVRYGDCKCSPQILCGADPTAFKYWQSAFAVGVARLADRKQNFESTPMTQVVRHVPAAKKRHDRPIACSCKPSEFNCAPQELVRDRVAPSLDDEVKRLRLDALPINAGSSAPPTPTLQDAPPVMRATDQGWSDCPTWHMLLDIARPAPPVAKDASDRLVGLTCRIVERAWARVAREAVGAVLQPRDHKARLHPSNALYAFLDDIYVTGPPEHTVGQFAIVREAAFAALRAHACSLLELPIAGPSEPSDDQEVPLGELLAGSLRTDPSRLA